MPKKVAEIIKMIEADGWYLVVVRGSHRQYKHPTKPGRTTVAGQPWPAGRARRCTLARSGAS